MVRKSQLGRTTERFLRNPLTTVIERLPLIGRVFDYLRDNERIDRQARNELVEMASVVSTIIEDISTNPDLLAKLPIEQPEKEATPAKPEQIVLTQSIIRSFDAGSLKLLAHQVSSFHLAEDQLDETKKRSIEEALERYKRQRTINQS